MLTTAEAILKYAKEQPEGTLLRAKGLLQLGSREAIDQALSRLSKEGLLLKVTRGAYVLPVEGKFGSRPPSVEKVIESLTQTTGEAVASNGAAAANSLGLTTQVPVRLVYVTAGKSRRLQLGKLVIEVKHAPKWQIKHANRPEGEAVRALAWMGKGHVRQTLRAVKQKLAPMEWQSLVSLRSEMPGWMAKAVSEAI